MFLTLILSALFLVSFFSPESLVTTVVGFLVSLGVTSWLKSATGLQGAGAAILAFVISFVVAIVAVVAGSFLGGSGFSWDMIGQSGMQIFALATITYKLLLADPVPAS